MSLESTINQTLWPDIEDSNLVNVKMAEDVLIGKLEKKIHLTAHPGHPKLFQTLVSIQRIRLLVSNMPSLKNIPFRHLEDLCNFNCTIVGQRSFVRMLGAIQRRITRRLKRLKA
jgi:hypothetical protein